MALSFSSVEKAYKVFNELKEIIPLSIPSWPQDMQKWDRGLRIHGFGESRLKE